MLVLNSIILKIPIWFDRKLATAEKKNQNWFRSLSKKLRAWNFNDTTQIKEFIKRKENIRIIINFISIIWKRKKKIEKTYKGV